MPARNPLTNFIRRQARLESPHSYFDDNYLSSYSNFELLPAAAVAAGTDKFFLQNTGVNPTAATRPGRGGVSIGTTGATADAYVLTGVTATPFRQLNSATNIIRLQAQVMLPAITAILVQFGMGQAPSATNPGAANSGTDSAEFFFDPTNALASGATVANWIARVRGSSGTVTYFSTSVPVVVNQEYEMAIELGADLKPKFYIDNSIRATSTIALAVTTQIAQFGVKTITGAAVKTLEIRYAKTNALIA